MTELQAKAIKRIHEAYDMASKFYRDFLRTTETLPENYDEEAEDYDETHIRRKQEAVESPSSSPLQRLVRR